MILSACLPFLLFIPPLALTGAVPGVAFGDLRIRGDDHVPREDCDEGCRREKDCNLYQTINNVTGALGLASNLAASFCPFSMSNIAGIAGSAATAGSFTLDALNWLASSGSAQYGMGGSVSAIASTVTSALSALAITAGVAALGPGFTAAIGSACAWNSVVGLGLGLLQKALPVPPGCNPSSKRRALEAYRQPMRLYRTRASLPTTSQKARVHERDTSDCEFVVSLFNPLGDFDFSAWDDVKSACENVRQYSPSDATDPELVDQLTQITGLCENLDTSDGRLLSALVEVVNKMPELAYICPYVAAYAEADNPPRYTCENEPVVFCDPFWWDRPEDTQSTEPTDSPPNHDGDAQDSSGSNSSADADGDTGSSGSDTEESLDPGCLIVDYRARCSDPEYPARKCERKRFLSSTVWDCNDNLYDQEFPFYDQVGPIIDLDSHEAGSQDETGSNGGEPNGGEQIGDNTSSNDESTADSAVSSVDTPTSTVYASNADLTAVATASATDSL